MDMADFPQRLTLNATITPAGRWTGSLRLSARSVRLSEVRSVYYRRPRAFDFPKGMSSVERVWADGEARAGLGGVLAALDCVWLSDPLVAARAECKPLQLAAAAAAGLAVPATMVTNDPGAPVSFAGSAPAGVVYKTLRGQPPGRDGEHPALIYTTPVQHEYADSLTSVALTAHQFQHHVTSAHAVRLTVVGDRAFAARIDAASERGRMDWRSDYDSLTYTVIDSPPEVLTGVLRFMDALGLLFAAMDFLVTDTGEWVFLEANPSGQWAFIPELRDPITAAIADLLQKGTPPSE